MPSCPGSWIICQLVRDYCARPTSLPGSGHTFSSRRLVFVRAGPWRSSPLQLERASACVTGCVCSTRTHHIRHRARPPKSPRVMKILVMLCIYFLYKSRRLLCAFKYIKNNSILGTPSLFAVDFVPTTPEPDTVAVTPARPWELRVTLLSGGVRSSAFPATGWIVPPLSLTCRPVLCHKATEDTSME